jgi:hypothetical protein
VPCQIRVIILDSFRVAAVQSYLSFICAVAFAQHGDLGTYGSAYWSELLVAYGNAHKFRTSRPARSSVLKGISGTSNAPDCISRIVWCRAQSSGENNLRRYHAFCKMLVPNCPVCCLCSLVEHIIADAVWSNPSLPFGLAKPNFRQS